jgi:peptide/nickel transport system permease protein
MVPGDEVLDYLSIDDSRYSSSAGPLEQRLAYTRVCRKRGLDLPHFYFSVTSGYYPDSLFSIVPIEDRRTVVQWVESSKEKDASLQLYKDLVSGLTYSCLRGDTSNIGKIFCTEIDKLLATHDLFAVHHSIIRLQNNIHQYDSFDTGYAQIISTLTADIELLIKSPEKLSLSGWLPSFQWHGTINQYHQWMSGLITFKPLTSLIDGRNAWIKILDALKWTLLLNGFAFFLAIALGILIGIWSGTHDGFSLERFINVVLFALFALPSFWLATLFIYFLSTGEWLTLFPAGGLGPYHSANTLVEKWGIIAVHLTLPVMCLALGSLAYVSRQMKQSVMHQLHQPYVLSLRAQGISEKSILRKHVIRNSLYPVITLIGGSIPGLLSGSLIIEVIFSIPGMGRLMYSSLMARDWPVVFPILMLSATITVITYILTDVVYKWADPRVKTMEP